MWRKFCRANNRTSAIRLLQQFPEDAVLGIVTGDDGAAQKHLAAAVEITDETTGLTHQDDASGHIPGIEPLLPETFVAAT